MARRLLNIRAARATAVCILTLIATLAALWLAPRVSDAFATWVSTPPVRGQAIRLADGLPVGAAPAAHAARAAVAADGSAGATVGQVDGSATGEAPPLMLDAEMQFTMLGLTCRPPAGAAEVLVSLRTSVDGSAWGPWYSAVLETVADKDSGAPRAFIEPIWTGAGRYVQVAAEASGAAAPAVLRDVRLVAINSTEDADRGAQVLGVLRRVAVAVAGLRFESPALAMTTRPAIVTRAGWGANEGLRSGTPSFAAVKMAFVHHTDGGNTYTRDQAPAVIRGVYYYHTKALGWSDIGYNFLVDRFGKVYEGRYGGVTQGPIGAQTLGFNTGSTGIAVLGTFVSATPPSAAVKALQNLLAWKLDVHHIDPLGTAVLTCGFGQKYSTGQLVTFKAISGHRDANYTACPGQRLYDLLPAIRKVVSQTGLPKIYDFQVGTPQFSPNGDAVGDRATFLFRLSASAPWQLTISAADGTVVRRVSGEGADVRVTWAGKDDGGILLSDGAYRAVVSAAVGGVAARTARADLVIDTVAPAVADLAVAPAVVSPNGDGHADRTAVKFRAGEAGSARVSILGPDEVLLRRVADWTAVGTEAARVVWDGLVRTGAELVRAPEGSLTVLVEVRDVAGNTTAARVPVTVDRTLGFPSVTPRTVSPNGDGVQDGAVLGFRLTRRAAVTVAIVKGGAVVRTLSAGTLESGARSVTWDGRDDAGAYLSSGACSARFTAKSTVGTVVASESFTSDLVRPAFTVPATKSVTLGQKAVVGYKVADRYSPTVQVTVTVKTRAGKTVAKLALGWVKQGAAATCTWKPGGRGTYILTFRAVDRGGNREAAPARTTTLTVR